MSRVWVVVRVLAVLAALPAGLYWIFRLLGEHARWSGVSLEKQARIRADIRRRRGLGELDHFDWLPDAAVPAVGTWTHRHGRVTYIRPVGQPCEACGTEEPA